MKVVERERPLPYSTSKKIVAIPVDQKASNAPIVPILNTELIVDVIQDMGISPSLFTKIQRRNHSHALSMLSSSSFLHCAYNYLYTFY